MAIKTISRARKSDEIDQIINAGVLSQLGRFGDPTIPPGDIQVHLSFVFFDYFSSSTLIIDAFIVVGNVKKAITILLEINSGKEQTRKHSFIRARLQKEFV
jgi:hypothetical protein